MEAVVLPAAVRVAARMLPIAGRKIVERAKQQQIALAATSMLVADTADRFIEQLGGSQLRWFREFVESPQFGQFMLQTMVCAFAGYKEEDMSAVRQEVRASIKHGGAFADEDMLQATDALVELLHSSVHAVRGAAGVRPDRAHALAQAAKVATAAARNSELLTRVVTLDEYRAFAGKLRSQVRALHSTFKLPHVGQARSIDYAQLYVTPTLRDAVGPDEDRRLETVVTQRLRSVILGDPGAGKSTLAAKLAHDLASDKIAGLEGQVPLMLVVRNHTTGLRAEHDTLIHYLEAVCRKPYNRPAPGEALEYLLLNGLATVIIDGVDELGDSHFRAGFAQMLEAFCNLYPLARVVVTSRVIGYDDAPLDAALFEAALIASFDERQVERYARQWFRLDSMVPGDKQVALRDGFMRDSVEANDLRANPLMLSLLCVLYSSERFIPQNRPGVYEKCAELLFDTWDRSRGIDVPLNFRQYVRPAVQQMAWRIFTDPQGRLAIPRPEMETFLATAVLHKRFDRPEDAAQAAHDFLSFCAGRAWVLTDTGSDMFEPHYGFVHKTFLEYFAAAQLVKQKPDPEAVWEKLKPHIDGGSWDVVSQVAVQILDRESQDGADELLRLMLDEVQRPHGAEYPRRPAALLQFGARCLDTVAPDGEIIRRLARAAVAMSANSPASARRPVASRPSATLAVVDGPLNALLLIRAPENARRVGNALAESLEDFARRLPPESSAGVIYQLCLPRPQIEGGLQHPTAEALAAELIQHKVLPPAGEMWRRLMFAPTAADVNERGLDLLFESSTLYHFRVHSGVGVDLRVCGWLSACRASDLIYVTEWAIMIGCLPWSRPMRSLRHSLSS